MIEMTAYIREWAGIKDTKLFFEGIDQSIMELNDGEKITFNEFADLIEQQW